MQTHIRLSGLCTLALGLVSLAACKADTMNLGKTPPGNRVAPLVPGTRAQVNGQGANCTTAGATICMTANPNCTITFDSNDQVTHLRCDVGGGLIFECTFPCPNVYECTWSDTTGCADIYNANGAFVQYECGQQLQSTLQCEGGDGGMQQPDAQPGVDGGSVCHGLNEMQCAAAGRACRVDRCPTCDPNSDGFVTCADLNDPPVACPAIACMTCHGLDQQACAANTACRPHSCPGCNGQQNFETCLNATDPIPDCPAPPNCGVCQGLGEMQCVAQGAACQANYCDECGNRTFVGCADPNTPPPPCPAITCPNCMGLDEQTCTNSAACHPVYAEGGTCGCAPAGCCIVYNHCADGKTAQCQQMGGPICALAPPNCGPNHVPSIMNGCWDGCVLPTECSSPQLCGAGGVWPSFNKACQIDSDCAVGIHQSDCCGTDQAIGINTAEQMSFAQDEAICVTQWPACGCPSRGIIAEDGMSTVDQTHVHVHCVPGQTTMAGSCETFVQ
jgi:hypothetical protein